MHCSEPVVVMLSAWHSRLTLASFDNLQSIPCLWHSFLRDAAPRALTCCQVLGSPDDVALGSGTLNIDILTVVKQMRIWLGWDFPWFIKPGEMTPIRMECDTSQLHSSWDLTSVRLWAVILDLALGVSHLKYKWHLPWPELTSRNATLSEKSCDS